MSSEIHDGVCLRLHQDDNVATALAVFPAGARCQVAAGDDRLIVDVVHEIPFGHKLALTAIAEGERIVKYGQAIGLATADIGIGEHVHRHNVKSVRGTGKTEGEAE